MRNPLALALLLFALAHPAFAGGPLLQERSHRGETQILELRDPETRTLVTRLSWSATREVREYFDPASGRLAQKCDASAIGEPRSGNWEQTREVFDARLTGNLVLRTKAQIAHFKVLTEERATLVEGTLFEPRTRQPIAIKDGQYASGVDPAFGRVNYRNPDYRLSRDQWAKVARAIMPEDCSDKRELALSEGISTASYGAPAEGAAHVSAVEIQASIAVPPAGTAL